MKQNKHRSMKMVLGLSMLFGGLFLSQKSANADTMYQVKSGDTLTKIANQNNTTIDQLSKLNNLTKDQIRTGQNLRVSVQTTSASTYTVKAGDTLTKIANANHTTVGNLQAINHLKSDLIYVGQTLNLHVAKAVDANTQTQVAAPQSDQKITFTAPRTNNQMHSQVHVNNTQQSSGVVSNTAGSNTANNQSTPSTTSGSKEWIAQRESGGSYNASNGQYYGRYQISKSSLNGDYSAENQERTADRYVASRYGSWDNAKQFWLTHHWY